MGDYKLLTNGLSNPYFGTNNLSDQRYSSINSIVYSLAKKGITDFYPFKILSLADLQLTGRAQLVTLFDKSLNLQITDYDYWLLTFLNNDGYLPLGDVIIPRGTNTNQVYVALVVNPIVGNNTKYSKLSNDSDFNTTVSSWVRNEGYWAYNPSGVRTNYNHRVIWLINSVAANANRNALDYASLGDIVTNGDGDQGPNSQKGTASWYGNTQVGNNLPVKHSSASSNIRPFATVNEKYIYRTNNNVASNTIISWNGWGDGINQTGKIVSISPFNTFAGTQYNMPNKGYDTNYFDIIPDIVLAAMCGNGNSLTSLNLPIIPTPVIPTTCQSFMGEYMSKNDFSKMTSGEVKDWCFSKDANCDTNLFTFCASGPDKKARPGNSLNAALTTKLDQLAKDYPQSANEICNCFMPNYYYRVKKYQSMISAYGDENGPKVYDQMNAQNAFNYPECSNSVCSNNQSIHTYNFKTAGNQQCPSVQVCLNNLTIDAKGAEFKNAPINVVQSNNCSQNGYPSGVNPVPRIPEKSLKDRLKFKWNSYSKKTKIIIISSVLFTIFMLLLFIL